jgi:DNA mismatch repair protein MutL
MFKAVYHCTKDSLLLISPILEIQDTNHIHSESNQFELISKNNLINEVPKIDYTQQEFKIERTGRESTGRDEIYDNGYSSKTNPRTILDEKSADNKQFKDFAGSGYIHNNAPEYNTSKEEKAFNSIPKFEPLAVVGQIHFTYIAAEGQDDMYLIDQHAAHERIYYENYMSEYKNSSIQSQNLLIPIVINITLSEKQQVFDNMELFKRFGYEIEDFGGNSIALRCVPMIYGNPDNDELFHEILNTFDIKDKDVYHVIDKVVYTMACKSAIKAGDKLNYREMNELIERLRHCDNPYNCPHGRPTIIKTSYTELEKKFKRIQ